MTATDNDLFSNPSRPAEPDDGVKRDRWGRYLLPHPKSGREVAWTRATTFAKTIQDTYVLNMWGRRMSIKGLTMREDLYALAAATGLDDRDTLNDIAERAAEAAGAKSAAALGTALHGFTEQHDRGETVTVPAKWRPDVNAYVAGLEEHGIIVEPTMIERIVVCERYAVAGTFDRMYRVTRPCVVELPGIKPFELPANALVMGDLKTGRDLSYGWGEIAVQLALYAFADKLWNGETGEYESMPAELDKRVAIVAHLPVGKAQCTLFDLNIALGWQAAELCESVRSWRKVRGLATPRLITSAQPTSENGNAEPTVEIEDPAGYGPRLDAARTIEDLSAIYFEASRSRQWNPALEARGMARRTAILADIRGETTE
jgi:hypothetical protein